MTSEEPISNRFRVALSFPGEHRDFVLEVANELAEKLTRDRVFYDRWYETELVGVEGDIKLLSMYKQADLVIPFFSKYYSKSWCSVEWNTIRGILVSRRKDDSVIPIYLDKTDIPGWPIVNYGIELRERTPKQIAELILKIIAKRRNITDKSVQEQIEDLTSEIKQLEQQLEDLDQDYKSQKQKLEKSLKSKNEQLDQLSLKSKIKQLEQELTQEKLNNKQLSNSLQVFQEFKKLFFIESLGNNINLEMVYIPYGSFLMGTEDEEIRRLLKKFDNKDFEKEKPQHRVTVSSFFMSKYPITQAQYRQVMGKIIGLFTRDPSYFKGDERPIEGVTWYDAVDFCQKLSKQTGKDYRLPSEAEWEYACRAETTTSYSFGEVITDDLVNYGRNVGENGETTTVGKFQSNAFGLYEMHGNVSEWCEDDWHNDYQDSPSDGSAWLVGGTKVKVARGGSWSSKLEFCRSASRSGYASNSRGGNIGFRVVCTVSKTV